jgi:hypothetical protein
VDRLSDWAKIAISGLLFALPPVALITRFQRPSPAANAFLTAAFTAAGAGIGVLTYAQLRHRREKAIAAQSATKSRFRALLANELKNRPLESVNFSELLAVSDIDRRAADEVADELFRKLADHFARNGIITEKEQSKLEAVAKALNMYSGRAHRIESDAKTARYHQAVSDALADGNVTEEEASLLNRLRWQLGVEDAAWKAGDLAPGS